MTPLLKKLIIALVVVLVAGLAYVFTMGSGTSEVAVSEDNSAALQASEEVLKSTQQLNQLKLDTKILEKPEFVSLRDTRVDLTEYMARVRTGRINPFAPIQ